MPLPTQEEVDKAIAVLAVDPLNILLETQSLGVRSNPFVCPIANYLKSLFPDCRVSNRIDSIRVFPSEEAVDRGADPRKNVVSALPVSLQRFTIDFDEKRYPTLEAPHAKDPSGYRA